AASCALTCAADGLVSTVPSGNTTVGTVWSPPFTDITNSQAASSRSMSTSAISIPSRASCRLRLRQKPHHWVVYIVSWPDTRILLEFASASPGSVTPAGAVAFPEAVRRGGGRCDALHLGGAPGRARPGAARGGRGRARAGVRAGGGGGRPAPARHLTDRFRRPGRPHGPG